MFGIEDKNNAVSDMERSSFHRVNLYVAFFLSGMSGLIYQIVWVRMLTRYLGSTTSATSTVLCVFMGGLAVGAYLGGKFADRIKRQLFGYVTLEICIAFTAILSSVAIISTLGGVYVNFHEIFGKNFLYLTSARIIFCIICLLPPTVLMGATLPFLVAFITRSTLFFQSGLGRLYSINTFGAVIGVFITGFVLIGTIGESSSLYAAALLNMIAALLVYRIQKTSVQEVESVQQPTETKGISLLPPPYPPLIRYMSGFAIFISGFTALAYEILWTRFLIIPLETSIYAFSFMLGLFLLGIALGSWLSIRYPLSEKRSAAVFAFFEILIGFLTVTGMFVFLYFGNISEGFMKWSYLRILTSFLIVFPVAVIFGWQFPIAVRCCISNSSYPGKETGWALSANTFGAILGSITAGFIMIPIAGTAKSFLLLAIINISVGVILLMLSPKPERGKLPLVSGVLVVVFALIAFHTGDPYIRVMEKRISQILGKEAQIYAYYETIEGNTIPAGVADDPLNKAIFINGISMTTLVSETKLMAHLPMALANDIHRVLVICFGMGTTVRSASQYPGAEKIDISVVDIVPTVFDCFKFFHKDADQIASKPNVHLYPDDGRNYLLVKKELYDVITIDPAPPIHSAGTVNLYTREFLEICKSKITKTGVVCLWLPPAPMNELLMIMKTFVNVFPGATLWGALGFPGFYLIGGHQSYQQTNDTLTSLAKRLSNIDDLKEWDAVYGNEKLLKHLYLLGPDDFEKFVEDYQEVTDDHPYTEFPLWRSLFSPQPILTSNIVRAFLQSGRLSPSRTN